MPARARVRATSNKLEYGLLISNMPTVIIQDKEDVKIEVEPLMSKAEKKTKFECKNCGKTYSAHKQLKKHKETGCDYRPTKSKKSKKMSTFKTKKTTNLSKSKENNDLTNVKITKVTKSSKKISSKNKKQNSAKRDADGVVKRVWSCKTCPQTFSTRKNLENHRKTHRVIDDSDIKEEVEEDDEFGLTSSKKIGSKRGSYKSRNKQYVCVVCSKGFCKLDSLINHQVHIHKPTVKTEESIDSLTKKTKKTVMWYLCDLCGKYTTHLKRHSAMHSGSKPFACSYCDRKFGLKFILQKHERIHTGERPYSCEYCGKRFRQNGPFAVHLRTHTGERPYVCNFCNKGFITNQLLKFHRSKCRDSC